MTTTYRALTSQEIIDTADEFQAYTDWLKWTEFAKAFYGPTASKMELEIDGEYDDEGGTDWSVTSVTVTDAAGEDLPCVATAETLLPFRTWTDEKDFREMFEIEDEDKRQEAIDEFVRDEVYGELPCNRDITTYDLGTPPKLTFPVLYVPVEVPA